MEIEKYLLNIFLNLIFFCSVKMCLHPYDGGVWCLDLGRPKGDDYPGIASCNAEVTMFSTASRASSSQAGAPVPSARPVIHGSSRCQFWPDAGVKDSDITLWSAEESARLAQEASAAADVEKRAAHEREVQHLRDALGASIMSGV